MVATTCVREKKIVTLSAIRFVGIFLLEIIGYRHL